MLGLFKSGKNKSDQMLSILKNIKSGIAKQKCYQEISQMQIYSEFKKSKEKQMQFWSVYQSIIGNNQPGIREQIMNKLQQKLGQFNNLFIQVKNQNFQKNINFNQNHSINEIPSTLMSSYIKQQLQQKGQYNQVQQKKKVNQQKKLSQMINKQIKQFKQSKFTFKEMIKKEVETFSKEFEKMKVQLIQKINLFHDNYEVEKLKYLKDTDQLKKHNKLEKQSIQKQEKQEKQKYLKKIAFLQTSVTQLNHEISKLNKQKTQTSNLKQSLLKEKQQSQSLKLKLEQINGMNQNYKQQINSLKKILKENKKNQGNQNEIISLKKQLYMLQLNSYFQTNLLQSQQKQNLKEMLEKLKNKNLQKTELLLTQNKQNKTDFHKFIDNRPNLLLIIQTEKQSIIGVFSEHPMQKEHQLHQQLGLLFNLNSGKSYELKKGKKCLLYDDYYFIVGNSDIRFHPNEDNFVLNISRTNYFEVKNDKNEDFLSNENQRNIKMKTFEIYQMHFQK